MCGRYALHANPDVVTLMTGIAELPAFQARYNIAPFSQVLILRNGEAAMVRWGLIPYWAKDPAKLPKMHNARADTITEKPSFREAYRRRRCLMPASGFYEWKTEQGKKQPYYIHPAAGELFSMAAIWERWGEVESCAVITTDANAKMADVHDRMPVLIAPEDQARWLSGDDGLLVPAPDAAIRIRRVSRAVNVAANDSPGLIEPEAE